MSNTKLPPTVHSSRRQRFDGRFVPSLKANHITPGCELSKIRTAGGQVVGEVRDCIFHKQVKASKHLLRSPKGWASDIYVLDQLDELGVEWLFLDDIESGKRYRATVGDFRRHGIRLDRGYGPQLVLPLTYWNRTQPGQPRAVQLPLDGVDR